MISWEMRDQLRPRRGFIDGDKGIVSLAPVIYLVSCFTFLDAAQLERSWNHRVHRDLWLLETHVKVGGGH